MNSFLSPGANETLHFQYCKEGHVKVAEVQTSLLFEFCKSTTDLLIAMEVGYRVAIVSTDVMQDIQHSVNWPSSERCRISCIQQDEG